MRSRVTYDAVVLAGGRASRLGADKPALPVAGRTLLDRVLDACAEARRVVVVGPERPTEAAVTVTWCREDPPGGGPVAGLLAGLPHTDAEVVVVLPADLPLLGDAVPRLVAAAVGADLDGAVLVDDEGQVQPLTGAYRRSALVTALPGRGGGAGRSMREIIGRLRLARLAAGTAALDCDTWDDVRRAEQAIRSGETHTSAREEPR